jgi:glycosyltransferase involved in cell wall biosynthesis
VIRVAFVLAGRTGVWLGGLNYYRNLLSAIGATRGTQLEPVLFVGERYDSGALTEFPPVEVHQVPMLDRLTPGWAARTLWRGGLASDRPLGRLLERNGVAVMSHSGHLGRFARVPAIGWVADLQHRRLPELFGRPMWLWRDAKYRSLAHFADHLLVGSEAGRSDLLDLAPAAAAKTSVLRFVVDPPPAERLPSTEELRGRYGLPERYLYLPNQFWVHKNHALVVEALRRLRARGRELTVVATGVPYDRRRPGHFEELMRRAEEAGVSGDFRVLGVVPYEHVTTLLRGATAMLNPSLFEGWSTTVEEAKSLGKRTLLSDIPVHREQAPAGSEYFDPHDPDALAELMERAFDRDDLEADRQLAERAAAELPERRRRFVETYEDAVTSTLARRS